MNLQESLSSRPEFRVCGIGARNEIVAPREGAGLCLPIEPPTADAHKAFDGGNAAALYRMVHSIPVGRPHKIAISNASYNAIAFSADAWSVETWDDVSHLPGATPFVES